MLKSFRNKKLMRVIMWSLVVIFAAWGVGSISMSGRLYAGSIFGKKISMQAYNRSYSAVLNRARMIYGEELPKVEKFIDLRSQAWDRLIMLYEARKLRIKATNREIIEKIAGFPFFQRNDIFNRGIYEYILASIFRVTPHDFEESIRGDIMIEKLVNRVSKDVYISEAEIRQAYLEEKELADVSFVVISPETYLSDIHISNEEILSFYQNHPERFLGPVSVNAEYIMIPYTENNKANSRFIADELSAQAREANTLKGLSETYGLELKETGNFSIDSEIPSIGMPYDFALTAFNLEQGQISDVLELDNAFYIIGLKSKTGPSLLGFDLAKDKAKEILLYERASAKALENAEKIMQDINNKMLSLEDIALSTSLDMHQAKGVSRKSYIEETGQSKDFASTAFALSSGTVGGPVKTQKGYAILRLDFITPIDEEEYTQEKDAYTEQLIERRKSELFQKWLDDLRKKARLQDSL
jgi:peptidyl-prolyl cis-trans isomerase D